MLTGVPPMPAPGRARRLQETIIDAAEDDVNRLADAVTRILEGETGAGTEQMIVVMIPLAKHELRDAVGMCWTMCDVWQGRLCVCISTICMRTRISPRGTPAVMKLSPM